MDTNDLKFYEMLKDSWDEERAAAFIAYFERGMDERVGNDALAKKQDLHQVREDLTGEIGKVRTELYQVKEDLTKDMAQVKEDLTKETAQVKEELTKEIGGLREEMHERVFDLKAFVAAKHADIVKWMFIFWAGTIGAMLAIVKLL